MTKKKNEGTKIICRLFNHVDISSVVVLRQIFLGQDKLPPGTDSVETFLGRTLSGNFNGSLGQRLKMPS